ncbi:MAG: hypothetical protein QNJ94_13120 [Alphaproteobacteria bacterium]|nr:hypothetical protein [Alphaproteobacteria bacterium]
MNSDTPRLVIDTEEPLPNAEAISQCLNYLQHEAARIGLPFASHLISVAAEAVDDSVNLTRRSIGLGTTVAKPNGGSRH